MYTAAQNNHLNLIKDIHLNSEMSVPYNELHKNTCLLPHPYCDIEINTTTIKKINTNCKYRQYFVLRSCCGTLSQLLVLQQLIDTRSFNMFTGFFTSPL